MKPLIDINLPETPQFRGDRETWNELDQIYNALSILAEHIAFLRLGIFTTTTPFAQNTPIISNPVEQVQCSPGIQQNSLLHIKMTPTGLFAELADSSTGKFANGIAKTNEAQGTVQVQLGSGILSGYSGLVPGKTYYLSSFGTFTALPNLSYPIVQQIGTAISATELHWSFVPATFN
jgi:hypothetical protein